MAKEEGIATAPAYTWYIRNFSKLTTDKLFSDIFVAEGYKWRLFGYPKRDGMKYLSLYLNVPDSSTLPDGWFRDVESFSITVVNQICPKDSIKIDRKHRFDAKESSRGFSKSIPLADIHRPARGYIVDDTLVVEVRISVSSESSKLLMRSKNLLEELLRMNNNKSSISSSEISESNVPLNCQSLGQQRKTLLDYLTLSLEASELANAFVEIERISLQLVQHSTNSLEKTILKDLVSRLPTFKEVLSTTKSTIRNLDARRKILSGKRSDVGSRLVIGQAQLSSHEAKYSVLSEEMLGLDAEILRLNTQKQELLARKKSMDLDLEKINDQVCTDIEEWKDIGKKTEETDVYWLKVREELARANVSWKLFQQNLELFQESG